MAYFHIGDIVTVVQALNTKVVYHMETDESNGANGEMVRFAGKKVTIDRMRGSQYGISEYGYSWTDEMFEEYVHRNDIVLDIKKLKIEKLINF